MAPLTFYNLPFPASLLLLLLGLVFLFPLCLLDMQPIQHRPSATNAPWLFRHVVHAAIYHVVILLCAGFPRTFIRSVRQAFLMFGHILLLLFSTMNILCKDGANIFKAVRSIPSQIRLCCLPRLVKRHLCVAHYAS